MDAATNNKNPKTVTLVRLPSGQATNRFTATVRGFLQDLLQVQRISSDLADQQHYCHLKGVSTRPLSRLEAAGPIAGRSHLPIQLWLLLPAPALALVAWLQIAASWQAWMLRCAWRPKSTLRPALVGSGQALISASTGFAHQNIELKRPGACA